MLKNKKQKVNRTNGEKAQASTNKKAPGMVRERKRAQCRWYPTRIKGYTATGKGKPNRMSRKKAEVLSTASEYTTQNKRTFFF